MSSSRPAMALRSSAAYSSSSRVGLNETRGSMPRDGRKQESFPTASKDSSGGRTSVPPVPASKTSAKEGRASKGGDATGSLLHARDAANVEASSAGGRPVDLSDKKRDGKAMASGGKSIGTKKPQLTDAKPGGAVKLPYDGRSGGGAGKTDVKAARVGARGQADGKAPAQGKPTIEGKAAATGTRLSDGKLACAARHASAQQQPVQSNTGKAESLPPHTEEELLKGLTLQAIWSENVEFTSLISAALRICRLSPAASDGDWNEAHNNFLQLLAMAKGRLSRQQSLFQAKYHDLQAMLDSQLEIQSSTIQRDAAILDAEETLVKAKKNRRNREEYEGLASEIAEEASVAELQALQGEQLEKRSRAEKTTKSIQGQIALKYRQAQVVLKAAADLLLSPQSTAATKKSKVL